MNVLEKLFAQYNYISNNKVELSDKISFIQEELSINTPIQLLFIGILNDLLINEPQYYYNKDVEQEVYNNLNALYSQDSEKFRDSFYKYQYNFFHSINSYYNVLDLFNEFDDVGFDNETKTKMYYLPIITQLMEFCLNHFYRGVASITGDLKGKDYVAQNTLGKLKNLLYENYPNLLDIDIDFRDAISHGTVEISSDKIIYSYTEKRTRKLVFKELKSHEINDLKNQLIDISTGAIIGLFRFLIKQNILNEQYLEKADEKINFELLKLFLHNENVKVKSFSKGNIGSSQLNIHIDIKNINDKNQIIHLLVLVGKIMYATFNNYERYFISYSHPFSINGFISLENSKLKNSLYEDNLSKIDAIISPDLGILIPDVQKTTLDNRSYKFHTFPRISGKNWEVTLLRDNSIESIKRFEARLIIHEKNIAKKEIENLLFQVTKKIRVLENKSNPKTKIKNGIIEAELVRLLVFYKTHERNSFSLFKSNENFICLAHYYKSKLVSKIEVPFQDNYTFENLKKLDIYWNKNYEEKTLKD